MGTPVAAGIGTPFVFTVNAVDANWNLVNATNTITITSTDGAATLPPDAALVGGTKDFTLTLNTVGVWTITASNVGGPPPTAGTSASITAASITITPATGGGAISADDSTSGAWTALTGPLYGEAASANVGTGTIIMNAPSGFIFDVGGTAPTVLVTRTAGAGANSRNINAVASGTSLAITSISTTQITFTVTSSSNTGVTNSLTWQNVRVRPNISYPLASGNITKSGTASMVGVTNGATNFGTLTEILGAPKTWSGLGDGINWNDAANWSPAGVPTGSNDVTIGANTINVNISTLAHDVTINNASASVTIPTGITLSVTNNYAQSNGTLNIATTFPTVVGTTTISGGTVNYNASSGTQTVGANTYNHLTISGAGIKQLGGIVTVSGNLTVGSGNTLDDAGFQITGNGVNTFTLNATASLTLGSAGTATAFPTNYTLVTLDPTSTVTYASAFGQTIQAENYGHLTSTSTGARTLSNVGTIGIAGTFTPGTNSYTVTGNTIDLNGSSIQSIPAFTYNNLTLTSGSAVTKTMTGAITVNGNLTINANNTLSDAGFQIVGNGTNTLSMAAGTTLTLGSAGTATLFPTNFINANIALTAGSTVIYNSDQSQTISGTPTYQNLTLNATSAVTKTIDAATTINGNLAINANNTLADAGFQLIGNVSGTMTMAAGTSLTLGTAGTATLFPTNFINGNITLSASSTVVYNSDQAQTISSVPTYGNVTLTATSSVTKTISSATTVATDLTVGTNNTLLVTGAGSVQINTGNLILNGSLDNSGTIDIGL